MHNPPPNPKAFPHDLAKDAADLAAHDSLPSHASLFSGRQTFAEIYGPNFDGCAFTISFDLEQRVPPPARGGSRAVYLRDRKAQMEAIRSDFERILRDQGLTGKLTELNFLSALGMATFKSGGAAADRLQECLGHFPYFKALHDSTDHYCHGIDMRAVYPVLWDNGVGWRGFTPHLDLPRLAELEELRFVLDFGAAGREQIVRAIEASLHGADLIGKIGIDLRRVDSGVVTVTCYFGELLVLTEIENIKRVISNDPKLISYFDETPQNFSEGISERKEKE